MKSSSLKFTDSQKLACDISRNIAVTAGAGSGKTGILVERYLWCLQNNGYQARRVIAITFTEKAAGEMLARVRARVLERAAGQFGDPQRWYDVLEKLPLAPISTIHGFCQRVLREFPIEAGVDPNFDIYDDALRHIELMRLVDDFLRARSDAHDPHIRIVSQLWPSSRMMRDILVQLIENRQRSLPWGEHIRQVSFDRYLAQVKQLVETRRTRGVRAIVSDSAWNDAIEQIGTLIPPNDSSKLSGRCRSLLEFDAEFRQQNALDEQLTTLGMLRKQCSLIGVTKAWREDERNVRLKEAFEVIKTLYARHLPADYRFHEELERSGFQVQQALAELLVAAYRVFQQRKAERRLLDFDDLQERALRLLQTPDLRTMLARRFDYIMVDEFQDTNHTQWEIIRHLGSLENGLEAHKFCVVGDEKQSIYMFRGAEVAVFSEVRGALRQANIEHNLSAVPPRIPELGDLPQWDADQLYGELVMAENFRSDRALIFFFNYLFSRLLLTEADPERPFEVRHQELRAGKAPLSSSQKDNVDVRSVQDEGQPVEFLLVNNTEQVDDGSDAPPLSEPELVARRILELVCAKPDTENSQEEVVQRKFEDIAVLLRTRTRLKEFEETLRKFRIPFVVSGGIGFYQQQEIYDLTNLLRVLVDSRQDIALAGVLRSPFFSFSDDQLLYVACGIPRPADVAASDALPNTLWDKLHYHARVAEIIPQELEPSNFIYAFDLLTRWKTTANKIPIPHLLRQILEETGFYGLLSAGSRSTQAISNVEKLLDLARNFEREGFQSLSDFVAYLEQLILTAEREGEAQIHATGNVIQLMTIHAAKGLEFPVVFVPEIERDFNYGLNESVYLDTLPDLGQMAAGIKGINPQEDFAATDTSLRTYLKELSKEKTDAEMKRLLYVACTRAQEHLIFSGTFKKKVPQNSWLAWLNNIFPLEEALAQKQFAISQRSQAYGEVCDLTIPVFTTLQAACAPSESDVQKNTTSVSAVNELAFAAFTEEEEPPGDVEKILQENMRPLTDGLKRVMSVNPSTVHLLFQCPRKYYYQHYLRLDSELLHEFSPQAPLQTSEHREFTGGAQRGSLIHKLFETRLFDREMSAEERSKAIDRFLDEQHISRRQRDRLHFRDAAQHAYRTYRETGLQHLLARAPEVYREYPFEFRLHEFHISGILDVFFRDPDAQTWTILDYKSNEVERDAIDEEIQKHGYDVQMAMYALAVARILDVEQVNGMLFFTFPGCRYEAFDLSAQALSAFEAKLVTALRNFHDEPLQSACEQHACSDCLYRQYGICE